MSNYRNVFGLRRVARWQSLTSSGSIPQWGGACNARFQPDRSINSARPSEAYTAPCVPGTLNRLLPNPVSGLGGVTDQEPLFRKAQPRPSSLAPPPPKSELCLVSFRIILPIRCQSRVPTTFDLLVRVRKKLTFSPMVLRQTYCASTT